MDFFVRKTQPPMLALLNVMKRKEKYLVQFMRVFLDANQKQPVYLGQKIPMEITARVTRFVKSNANLTSFFARMVLILKAAKMPTYVYLEEGIMMEICVLEIAHRLVPIMNTFVQEDFKVLDVE